MNWTQEQYNEYKAKIAHANRTAVSVADMEQTVSVSPLAKKKDTRLDTRDCKTSLLITSYRHRLTDSDGVSAKYAIDALVLAGIYEDDSPDYIEEVRYKQEKIGKDQEEYTVIEIYQ